MKTIEKIAGENNGCNRMRLIRTIETEIALTKLSLLTPNLCQNHKAQKKLVKLERELQDAKAREHTKEIIESLKPEGTI